MFTIKHNSCILSETQINVLCFLIQERIMNDSKKCVVAVISLKLFEGQVHVLIKIAITVLRLWLLFKILPLQTNIIVTKDS